MVTIVTLMAAVFARTFLANESWSLDSAAYLYFFESIKQITPIDLLTDKLIFPYVFVNKLSPFEIGFVIISKTISYAFNEASSTYGAIAAISVGLRVHVMRKFGAPWLWILLINIYAITLFEANALRLGLASGLIVYSLYAIQNNRKFLALLVMAIAPLVHLQAAIFVAPLLLAWVIIKKSHESKTRTVFVFATMGISALVFISLMRYIDNQKFVEYLDRGQSGSAGVTVTSTLGAMFVVVAAYFSATAKRESAYRDVWTAVMASSIVSIILLIGVTDVAVIGDRAWQLSFVVLAALSFSDWIARKKRIFPLAILCAAALVATVNVTIRYPLSNFFSPPLPEAQFGQR